MVDQPDPATQPGSQLPTETTPSGTHEPPEIYGLNFISEITDALKNIGKNLFLLAIFMAVIFGVFGEEFNIRENTLIVLVSVLAFIALVVSVIYLWYRYKYARTFGITSDSIGLTLQKDKEITKIPWDEVAAFQGYRVEGIHGEFIDLPPELEQRDKLKEDIDQNAAESITEHLVSKFKKEGKVTLGIVEITPKGLLIQDEFIPWEDIASIERDEVKLRVMVKSDSNAINTASTSEISDLKTRRTAPLSEIPNSYALNALVAHARQRPDDRVVLHPVAEKSIFISYRRIESDYISGQIFEHLAQHFGKDAIFKDVYSIPLGVDFRKAIDENVGKCQVLLAIIGAQWLSIKNDEGNRRLFEPGDFVRIEIESALKREIPVIPLLVGKVTMPTEDDLPTGLEELAFREGIRIRPDPDFQHDMSDLIESLKNHLSELPKRDAA